jgi:hypothetical protein
MYYNGATNGASHSKDTHLVNGQNDGHGPKWWVTWHNGCASDRPHEGCYNSGCDSEGGTWHGNKVNAQLTNSTDQQCFASPARGAFGAGVTYR